MDGLRYLEFIKYTQRIVLSLQYLDDVRTNELLSLVISASTLCIFLIMSVHILLLCLSVTSTPPVGNTDICPHTDRGLNMRCEDDVCCDFACFIRNVKIPEKITIFFLITCLLITASYIQIKKVFLYLIGGIAFFIK